MIFLRKAKELIMLDYIKTIDQAEMILRDCFFGLNIFDNYDFISLDKKVDNRLTDKVYIEDLIAAKFNTDIDFVERICLLENGYQEFNINRLSIDKDVMLFTIDKIMSYSRNEMNLSKDTIIEKVCFYSKKENINDNELIDDMIEEEVVYYGSAYDVVKLSKRFFEVIEENNWILHFNSLNNSFVVIKDFDMYKLLNY